MSSPRKRPWNLMSMPVYSVSSYDGDRHNMNICTYVTPVSMKPKRFIVALYKDTKTLQNVQHTQHFVLQMLGAEQSVLVHRLSKFSGYKKDKLKTMKNLLADYHGFKILRDAVAVIEMHVLSLSDGGDHMIALCDVVSHKNLTDTDVLTLDHLRAEKLIAI